MHTRELGGLWPVSALTLGGGIGGMWGESSHDERIATVHEAVERGITLLDLAPLYNEAEAVVGEAFAGALPAGVHVTTKYVLGNAPEAEVYDRLRASLETSLELLRLDRVDVFFLHGILVADGVPIATHPDIAPVGFGTSQSVFEAAARPALQRLVDEGLAGAWGITGHGTPAALLDVIAQDPAPAAIQCIANALDAPGLLFGYDEERRPREIIAAAKARGIGVMGIRAVLAGALTDGFDRDVEPDSTEQRDFDRAAPFRAVARDIGVRTAYLAYRYALSMPDVDTHVLGVKNREELRECLQAEADGPLDAELVARIDRAVGLS